MRALGAGCTTAGRCAIIYVPRDDRRTRLTHRAASARVAVRLLELAAAHAVLDGSRAFKLLLSQDEMAHVLGTSRESVARALGELRAHGIIEQRGAHIRVADAQALFEWSHLSNSGPLTPLPSQL